MWRVKNINKYIENNCASRWSFTKNHYMMHGQQNIKWYFYSFIVDYFLSIIYVRQILHKYRLYLIKQNKTGTEIQTRRKTEHWTDEEEMEGPTPL